MGQNNDESFAYRGLAAMSNDTTQGEVVHIHRKRFAKVPPPHMLTWVVESQGGWEFQYIIPPKWQALDMLKLQLRSYWPEMSDLRHHPDGDGYTFLTGRFSKGGAHVA